MKAETTDMAIASTTAMGAQIVNNVPASISEAGTQVAVALIVGVVAPLVKDILYSVGNWIKRKLNGNASK